jgi:carboxypeptidase PM20D1
MKKMLGILSLALAVLATVLVYRAETVFEDRQAASVKLATGLDLDETGAVRRFARAITFPTVSHDERSNFNAAAFLDFQQFLAESYPLVHRQLEKTVVGDYSVVFHLRGADSKLKPALFMGHMDVVPIDPVTRDQWTHDPFGGVVANGKVWGRGTMDDKLSVITLLEAMEQLMSEGRRPQRSVYLAFGHDEEVGGQEGARKIAGWFADQGVTFEFVLDEGGVVTKGLLSSIPQPVAIIGVAEKGWVNLELVVNAPGGHSSQPPDHTAVGILSAAIARVEDNPFPANLDYMLMTFDFIGSHMPFSERLLLANSWLFSGLIERQMIKDPATAAGVRTTTAATMIAGSPKSNILPTRASAIINFRMMPGETGSTVKARVARLIDDERVQVSMKSSWDPSPVSPTDSAAYELIAGTIRALDPDVLVAPYLVRAGTDAKYYYPLSDNVYRFIMVRVDAETMHYIHGIDEHVAVADYLRAIRFYHQLIARAME